MFGFNRNRGIFSRYNRYNNYDNYTNPGPFGGYNNRMREESFIRKYIIFRIMMKFIGPIFILLILVSAMSKRTNYNNINTNNSNTLNSSYSVNNKI